MEKIKIGEYIRTKTGKIYKIDKIDKCPICKEKEYINTEIKGDLHFENIYHKKDIIKHSSNIIDLIEVGDYVNGLYIHGLYENGLEVYRYGDCHDILYADEIKSIVTKEQFADIEYRLEN